MNTIDELFFASWLANRDAERFATRLERLDFLAVASGSFGELRSFPAGPIGLPALMEAKWSFVNGQFLATVCLVLLVVEHLLSGQLREDGSDASELDFPALLGTAQSARVLTPERAEALLRLREHRNQYVHASPRFTGGALHRLEREGTSLDTSFEADAKTALTTLFGMLQGPPFKNEEPVKSVSAAARPCPPRRRRRECLP